MDHNDQGPLAEGGIVDLDAATIGKVVLYPLVQFGGLGKICQQIGKKKGDNMFFHVLKKYTTLCLRQSQSNKPYFFWAMSFVS